MARKLTVSLVPNALTAPLLDGEAGIDGVEIDPVRADRVDANTRAMMRLEFDIAEMSLATYVKLREDGAPLVGLPIFTGRRFCEPGIGVRKGAGIQSPGQLAGRRVGFPQFWMTSSVWHRAVLSAVYGVPAEAVRWVSVQAERFDDRVPAGGVAFEYRLGGSVPAMLEAGELDAVVFPRPVAERFDAAHVACLFAEVAAAQRGFLSRTGLFPIMHFVVAQQPVLSANPGLAEAMLETFEQIKARFLRLPDRASAMESPIFGMGFEDALDDFGGDAWPYGLEANAAVLAWFLDQAHRQGLTRTRLAPHTLFAA